MEEESVQKINGSDTQQHREEPVKEGPPEMKRGDESEQES